MYLNMGYAHVFVPVCVHGGQRKVTLSVLFHSLNLQLCPVPPYPHPQLLGWKPANCSGHPSFVNLPFLVLGPQGYTHLLACYMVAGIRTLVFRIAWQVFLTSEPLSYLSSPFDHYFYNMFNLFFYNFIHIYSVS